MKRQLLQITLTTWALTVGVFVGDRQPIYAQTRTFSCIEQDGYQFNAPTIIASTPRGDFKIIEWSSPDFERWTNPVNGNKYNALERCRAVANKFQIYYDCDLLDPKYIAAATIPLTENGKTQVYPAVLITNLDSPKAKACFALPQDTANSLVRGLLFMLPPQADIYHAAEQVRLILNQMDDIRSPGDASIAPIRN
jgi:hypothetical protein